MTYEPDRYDRAARRMREAAMKTVERRPWWDERVGAPLNQGAKRRDIQRMCEWLQRGNTEEGFVQGGAYNVLAEVKRGHERWTLARDEYGLRVTLRIDGGEGREYLARPTEGLDEALVGETLAKYVLA